MRRASFRRQRGVTLIIGLILLVLMTLFAMTAFNVGRSNLIIVGNMQSHEEAVAVATSAIEEVLSKNDFSVNPSTSLGGGSSKSYEVNGNAGAITVDLSPLPCIKQFKNVTIDPSDPTTQGCAESTQQQFGVQGASTGGTGCADVIWEITAVATDNVTQAKAAVAEGVRIRQDAAAAANSANFCS